MKNGIFIKTVFISLLGHLTVFGFFSFSFGNRIPVADYSAVSFWGAILSGAEIRYPLVSVGQAGSAEMISARFQPPGDAAGSAGYNLSYPSLKPAYLVEFQKQRMTSLSQPLTMPVPAKRKEQVFIFHPLLPQNFFLYFNDRQVAHVELMFKIASAQAANPVMIKRSISSGSLEADLLTLRYMEHYLFLQRDRFPPDVWQTIKIDLSAKE